MEKVLDPTLWYRLSEMFFFGLAVIGNFPKDEKRLHNSPIIIQFFMRCLYFVYVVCDCSSPVNWRVETNLEIFLKYVF